MLVTPATSLPPPAPATQKATGRPARCPGHGRQRQNHPESRRPRTRPASAGAREETRAATRSRLRGVGARGNPRLSPTTAVEARGCRPLREPRERNFAFVDHGSLGATGVGSACHGLDSGADTGDRGGLRSTARRCHQRVREGRGQGAPSIPRPPSEGSPPAATCGRRFLEGASGKGGGESGMWTRPRAAWSPGRTRARCGASRCDPRTAAPRPVLTARCLFLTAKRPAAFSWQVRKFNYCPVCWENSISSVLCASVQTQFYFLCSLGFVTIICKDTK